MYVYSVGVSGIDGKVDFISELYMMRYEVVIMVRLKYCIVVIIVLLKWG